MSYLQGLRALLVAHGVFINDATILTDLKHFTKENNKSVLKLNVDLSDKAEFENLIFRSMRVHYDHNIPAANKSVYMALLISEAIRTIMKKSDGAKSILIPLLVEIVNKFFAEEAAQIIRQQRIDQFGGEEFVNKYATELQRLQEELNDKYHPSNTYRAIVGERTVFHASMSVNFDADKTRFDYINAPYSVNEDNQPVNSVQFVPRTEKTSKQLIRLSIINDYFSKQNKETDQAATNYIDRYIVLVVMRNITHVLEKKLWWGPFNSKVKTHSMSFIENFKKILTGSNGLADALMAQIPADELALKSLVKKGMFNRDVNYGTVEKPSYQSELKICAVIFYYWCTTLYSNTKSEQILALVDEFDNNPEGTFKDFYQSEY